MMDRSQAHPTGWAQRLQDWEQSAPARPGEGPAPDFWDRLEPELPPPPPRSSGPLGLWLVLGLFFLTHFTCFRPELSYFPLPATIVADSNPATPAGENDTPAEATSPASASLAAALPDTAFAENTTTPGVRAPSRPAIRPPQATVPGDAPPSAARDTAFAERAVLLSPTVLPRPAIALRPTTDPTAWPSTVGDTAYAEISAPVAGTPEKGTWQLWAGAHYAPVSNRTRLTIDPGVLTASRTRQLRAPEVGANVYLQFGDHWGLRSGFTTNRIETESQYRFIRFFNPLFEAPNTAGDGVSKYSVEVASAYAKSSAEVELVRPQDRNLQNGARLRLDLYLRENVVLQSIPLQVTYSNRWGRFALSGQLGPEWTHVNVQDFTAGARVQRAGLRTNRVRIQSRERISRSSYWSVSGGVAASYALGDRWRASLIPEFTTSLENLANRSGFTARSHSTGVRLEMAYRLR